MNRFELKQLVTRKAKLKAKLKILEKESREAELAYKEVKQQLTSIEKTLKDNTKDLVISEHAILQFMQRYLDIDINEIKEALINPKVKDQIKTLGNGTYPTPGGHRVVVKNMVIVTVV